MNKDLYYILTIDKYPSIYSMVKRLENVFDNEIPFLQKVLVEKQKIIIREYLNKLERTPSYLKMTVSDFGTGDIIFEYYE